MSTLLTRIASSLVVVTLAAAPLAGCHKSGAEEPWIVSAGGAEPPAGEAAEPSDLDDATLASDVGLDAEQQVKLANLRHARDGMGGRGKRGKHGGKRGGRHGGKNAAVRIERRVEKLTAALGLSPQQIVRLRQHLQARAERVGQSGGATDPV